MNLSLYTFWDGPIYKSTGIFLIVLALAAAIVSCKFTAKKYADTNVRITKDKIIFALSSSAYDCLKAANMDFEEYLDSLIESVLYDLKNR